MGGPLLLRGCCGNVFDWLTLGAGSSGPFKLGLLGLLKFAVDGGGTSPKLERAGLPGYGALVMLFIERCRAASESGGLGFAPRYSVGLGPVGDWNDLYESLDSFRCAYGDSCLYGL